MNIDGIQVLIEGSTNPDAQTIVMIHGWPDTLRLWDAQVEAFKHHFRCVRFTVPGFDRQLPIRAHSLDELVRFIQTVVQKVSPNRAVILLVHDWGCLFGYEFNMRHPELVSAIIGVDIGDVSSPDYLRSLGLKAKLMIATYQLWLALAWAIGGGVGSWMTRAMARALRCPSDPTAINVGMNYPYFIQWTGRHGSYRRVARFAPACPMLFVYGRKKPFMFHSKAWAQQISGKPANKAVQMNTGHWVMTEQATEFNNLVLSWLANNPD